MTPLEINKAIAQVCGYKPSPDGLGWLNDRGIKFYNTDGFPNYVNDLNAMHEAEKVLTWEQRAKYCDSLAQYSHSLTEYWYCSHATATQRAEAFLKIFNLWKK